MGFTAPQLFSYLVRKKGKNRVFSSSPCWCSSLKKNSPFATWLISCFYTLHFVAHKHKALFIKRSSFINAGLIQMQSLYCICACVWKACLVGSLQLRKLVFCVWAAYRFYLLKFPFLAFPVNSYCLMSQMTLIRVRDKKMMRKDARGVCEHQTSELIRQGDVNLKYDSDLTRIIKLLIAKRKRESVCSCVCVCVCNRERRRYKKRKGVCRSETLRVFQELV